MAKIIPVDNGSKRDVVIKSAAAMFRDKGFAATSMGDIAGQIGIEAPSLYNHIASKKKFCGRYALELQRCLSPI